MPKTPTRRQTEKMMVTLCKMQERTDNLSRLWAKQMGYEDGGIDEMATSCEMTVLNELESVSCSLEMALQELNEMLEGGWV